MNRPTGNIAQDSIRPPAEAAVRPLDAWRGRSPLDVAAAWPSRRRLVLLHSGRLDAGRSRWSILAVPRRWLRLPAATAASDDPLERLDRAIAATSMHGDAPLPFVGGWIATLGYELGAVIEPAARGRPNRDAATLGAAWPTADVARCDAALVHDALDDTWHVVGAPRPAAALEASVRDRTGRRPPRFGLGPWRSIPDRAGFEAMVAQTVELIRAGDIFQANIARMLRADAHGSMRGLGLAALRAAAPWYGALLELPGRRVVASLSPELFLAGDFRDGSVLTRPVKGTRPAKDNPDDLLRSPKDAAELVMIVDLMRNDLGRVCTIGSVAVTEPRHVESHPTVHHGVAGIAGRMRPGTSIGDLLRATFPPGSVTGAPKIRAMQVIDALEPSPRGPYCGAIGFVSDHGPFAFNVAIRTLALAPSGSGHAAAYGVGCGIVSDSEPAAEWLESEDKAAVVRRLATTGGCVAAASVQSAHA